MRLPLAILLLWLCDCATPKPAWTVTDDEIEQWAQRCVELRQQIWGVP